MVASAAIHTNPGTANHLLRKFIREFRGKGELINRLCEEFHKRSTGGKMSGPVLSRKMRPHCCKPPAFRLVMRSIVRMTSIKTARRSASSRESGAAR
jgi:hypothetical protein